MKRPGKTDQEARELRTRGLSIREIVRSSEYEQNGRALLNGWQQGVRYDQQPSMPFGVCFLGGLNNVRIPTKGWHEVEPTRQKASAKMAGVTKDPLFEVKR